MAAVATQSTNLSGSGAIAPDGAIRIVGIMVRSSSSLTLKIWDNPAAAGTAIPMDTTGVLSIGYLPIRASLANGGFCTFGGTGSITIFWERA